jgi:hypothetical protein
MAPWRPQVSAIIEREPLAAARRSIMDLRRAMVERHARYVP